MVRNNLELACDSLFIEKIKKAFKATEPFINQGAGTFTVAGGLFPTFLRKNCDEAVEIRRNFGKEVAAAFSDLNFHFALKVTTKLRRRVDIRPPIKFPDRQPP